MAKKTAAELSAQAFAKLLKSLDPNDEKAGEQYNKLKEKLREKLEWLLERYGCSKEKALELADICLDRVANKLLEGAEIESIKAYSLTVARFLIKEQLRDPLRNSAEVSEVINFKRELQVSPEQLKAEDYRVQCLEECLQTAITSDDDRRLILKYYDAGENEKNKDNRKKLLQEFNLTAGNLKAKTSRLRDKLEKCINECVAKKEAEAV